MGLSSRLVIIKGKIEDSYEDFIKDLGFHEPKKIGEKALLNFRVLPDNQIAIGECNGFVFICHYDLPMYFIENAIAKKNYTTAFEKINKFNNKSRYIAAIFQSSINGFGYGIYDKGDRIRHLIGDYEGILFEGGEIQKEEEMILKHPDSTNQKAMYSGKERDLHAIGTELTYDVLDNYCGQDFLMENLKLSLFSIGK